ncbi:tRNA pseudouridine(55) synthase TruB [Rubrivirga sp. S365]|uniref:tRNA pseudouridine synthase B n=1 Tax=Rubrivirga litoralis TaxID=3075598 RepID=A0ABU3BUW9_9BACT|nr:MULTISPECIES: tRNA pseudouridine(55) synthase TruB [unclassified Rubrivirga]MDT0633083.1 tRNA pseudouridine(55) synthase TruB [Rubrivirga sp. F394]MDT7856915.1 tRNA pseudouridine(55) synthase TruB [Rubrivirga sp. S365]
MEAGRGGVVQRWDVVSDLRIVTRADAVERPFEAGALLVDKPPRITSFGVVKKVRWALGVKKVGHAGTLDPLATGLLILLVGREATRQQDRFMGLPKVYTGTLRLGQTTPSYDADTPVEAEADAQHVTDADLDAARLPLVGEIMQRPPVYSAIKKGGERLYKKARRGETVEIEARPTTVTAFDLVARRGDDVDFRVECSKGTYVRSLAHDLGQALGVGAHLVALRREAIGPFRVDEAFALDALVEAARPEAA